MYHIPVLADKSLEMLDVSPEGVYVDATYGGGGHSSLILNKLSSRGKLYAFDQDPDALKNIIDDTRLFFIQQNFRYVNQYLHFYDALPVDGVFADLGVSSYQLDEPTKGFSYLHPEESLDMRMNNTQGKTAADVLNTYSDENLAEMFFKYADLNFARKLAREILKFRIENRFSKICHLTQLVDKFVFPDKRYGIYSRIFQALRMEVNDEVGSLEEFLKQAYDSLKPGGRLVVISYHSVEDRMVKNFFRSGNVEGIIEKDFYGVSPKYFEILTKKPLIANEYEIKQNIRSRSAKLRAAIKL